MAAKWLNPYITGNDREELAIMNMRISGRCLGWKKS